MERLGKQTILYEAFTDGRSTIAITSTMSVYRRRDGSLFVNRADNKRRLTITRRDDGMFYMRCDFVRDATGRIVEVE